MIHWIVTTLQQRPELVIFLTLALGYYVGKIKIGPFSLGAVAAAYVDL
jgi:putative transport protein